MQTFRASARCLVALAAFAACVSAQAGLNGVTFSSYYYGYPNIDTAYADATTSSSFFSVVEGNGVDAIFMVEDTTRIAVDFSDTSLSLLLTTSLENPRWNQASFSGLVFNVSSGEPLTTKFSGWIVDPVLTTMPGFTSDRVNVTDGRLTVDWNHLAYDDGTRVVVNFAAHVPEPGTYALLALGLAVVGGATRARRRSSCSSGGAQGN